MFTNRPLSRFIAIAICLPVCCSVATAAHYETSAQARATAASLQQQLDQCQRREQAVRDHMGEMSARLDAFKQRGADVGNVDQRIAKIRNQVSRLESQKIDAIKEVLAGMFCSDCKRSKTQIEIEERPTTFEQHIQEGAAHGRHPIKTPELIAEARKKTEQAFDDMIAPLQSELDALRQERAQKVQAFNDTIARMQHDLDLEHLQLTQIGAEEDNARFQLNYANSMMPTLEQAERWKAESERRRELDKAREEKLAADRARREAERRAREAAEEVRKAREAAQREAAEETRRRATEAEHRAVEAEQARQQALQQQRLARDEEDRRRNLLWMAMRQPVPPAPEPAPQRPGVTDPSPIPDTSRSPAQPPEQAASNPPPANDQPPPVDLSPATKSVAQAMQTLDRLRDELREQATGTAVASTDTPDQPLMAIDSLASLGQPEAAGLTDGDSHYSRIVVAVGDKLRELKNAATTEARDEIQAAIQKDPGWLLDKPLDYGRETFDQRVDAAAHTAMHDLVESLPGGKTGVVGLVKDKVADRLAAYASEQARQQLVSHLNDMLLGRQPLAEGDGHAAERADRRVVDAASQVNLFYRTTHGSGGHPIAGLKSYWNDQIDAFGKQLGMWTTEPATDQ